MTKTEKRSQRRIRHREARIQRRIANEPPKRSVLEEIGNSVTHGIGAALAIAGLVLMLMRSETTMQRVAAIIYGTCLMLLFLMSCLYHAFRSGSTVKRIFRRFDYSSIYLLIGGTFAPLLLLFVRQPLGLWIFGIQWAIIATGISIIGVFGPCVVKKLHTAMYFVLGWSAVMFLPDMMRRSPGLFWMIFLGGVAYSLGAIPFAMKKKGAHFIWHFFVLLGAVLQFLGIYEYLF